MGTFTRFVDWISSGVSADTAPASTDMLAVIQGGATKSLTLSALISWIFGGGQNLIVPFTRFGAVSGGVADNSTAWAAAIAFCNAQVAAAAGTGYPIATATLYIPAGNWLINTGTSVANCNLRIVGSGVENTRVTVAAGITLLTISGSVYQLDISDISFEAGAWYIQHTSTGTNVQGISRIQRCNFNDYTGGALGSLSSDYPYWRITDNIFRGASALTSKGVVLAGLADGSKIESNAFLANRYNIKLGQGANNVYIKNNDFVKFNLSGVNPQVDIWVIPQVGSPNSGSGLLVTGNKFGNENLTAGDLRILIADEGAGTNSFDKNNSTSVSTGFWTGFNINDNLFAGGNGSTKGLIYSYTPSIGFGRFEKNTGTSTKHPYILEYDAGITFTLDDRTQQSCIFEEPLYSTTAFETAPMLISNANQGIALIRDEYGVLHGTPSYRQNYGSGFDSGFKPIVVTSTGNPGLVNATAAALTDPVGGGEASTITYSSAAGYAFFSLTTAGLVVGRAAWLEFAVKQSAVNPILSISPSLQTDAGNILARRAGAVVSDHWTPIRIPFIPVQNSATLRLRIVGSGYVAGVTEQLDVALLRVYHAHEPYHQGYFQQGKTAVSLPAVLKASTITTNVGNVGAGEDDLMTYSLPANSMFEAKKGVEIHSWGTATNNANAKTVKQYFGTVAVASQALTINQAGRWSIKTTVISTGASAQDYSFTLIQGGAATILDTNSGTLTQTDTAAITVKCTGTATADNDIVQEGMTIKFLN